MSKTRTLDTEPKESRLHISIYDDTLQRLLEYRAKNGFDNVSSVVCFALERLFLEAGL